MASDPDGDTVTARLEVRAEDDDGWESVARVTLPARESSSGDPDTSWREGHVTWLTAEHTHAKVPVTASGPGADRLRGVHENTAVFDLMLDYLGLENAVESE